MIASRRARGFETGHEPVYNVPKRKKGGTTANHVPSRKSVTGEGIRAANPLMRDFIWHLEVDPSVELISPYPVQVEYQTYDRYGPVGTDKHIAHVGILHVDGSTVYCDIIPEALLKEQRFRLYRRPLLEKAYFDQFGAGYAIHTELTIHQQPRMNNVRRLWRDIRNRDVAAMRAVRRALDVADAGKTTIGNIVERSGYPDREAAVASVLQLVCSGYLEIDLSTPITEDTSVVVPELIFREG